MSEMLSNAVRDNLRPLADDARAETDCYTDRARSESAVHGRPNESLAFAFPALGYVHVTLRNGCWRIGLGSDGLTASADVSPTRSWEVCPWCSQLGLAFENKAAFERSALQLAYPCVCAGGCR